MAVTVVATSEIAYNTDTDSADFPDTFTWQTGDWFVFEGGTANGTTTTISAPSNANLTFSTCSATFPDASSSACYIRADKAEAGSAQSNQTISISRTAGTDVWGGRLVQYRGASGIGTVVGGPAQANQISMDITAGSHVFGLLLDWDAGTGNNKTGVPTITNEDEDAQHGSDYTVWQGRWANQLGGTRNYGVDVTETTHWSWALVEILSAEAPPAAITVRNWASPTNVTDSLPAFSINLPTRVSGDVLLAFIAHDSSTAITPTGSWTELSDEAGTGANRLGIYARIATNDANDNLSLAAGNNADSSVNVCSIYNHAVTNVATDIIKVAAATGASGNADPPSIDGGSVADWLAFAIACVDLTATGSSISAYPGSYEAGVLQKSASSTSSVALGVGQQYLADAQTENPGTFTNTSGAWIAKTLLVPPVVTGINVSAEAATGVGASYNASVALEIPLPAAAVGTGAAYDATVAITYEIFPQAEAATGVGAAYDATVAIEVQAGSAAGTGAAYDATVQVSTGDITVFAEAASGTGAALDATVTIVPQAGTATGQGAALDATGSLTVTSGAATGLGEALFEEGSEIELVLVFDDPIDIVGAAYDATIATQPAAGAATGTGTAYDATVQITYGDNVTALAEAATGQGTAYPGTVAIEVPVGLAEGTGAALSGTVAAGPRAGAPTGTGAALDASMGIAPAAEVAAGQGTAYDATVQISSGDINVFPGAATGQGAAYDATVQISTGDLIVNAGVAAGVGSAYDAGPILDVSPGVAAGLGAALDPTTTVAFIAETAQGLGAAEAPAIGTLLLPASATGSGAALDASLELLITAETAAGLGAAYQPKLKRPVRRGSCHITIGQSAGSTIEVGQYGRSTIEIG